MFNSGLREGWKWKSSVEQSGTEIETHSLTEFRTDCFVPRNDQNEGAPKEKLVQKKSALLSQNGLILNIISRIISGLLRHKLLLRLP